MQKVTERLFELQDLNFRDFHVRLIPGVEKETVIGVKTPHLRALAKELLTLGDEREFLRELPHSYYEENQIHAILLSELKDYEELMSELELFLPYVDNWATCDILNPKLFKRQKKEVWIRVNHWLSSEHTYTVRFAIAVLMRYFLTDKECEAAHARVSQVCSDEYYIKMMIAWYFATALACQYEKTLPYLLERRLEPWTHNKIIQKARESYRITKEQKEYLKTLKVVEREEKGDFYGSRDFSGSL